MRFPLPRVATRPWLGKPGALAVANARACVLALICALMVGVFLVDIATPPDDVSICFTYAVLIAASIYSYRGTSYWCAGLATTLSCLGAFFLTPPEALSLAFFSNRGIAVATQWVVAFLVAARQDAEAMIRAEYETERKKAETNRRVADMLSHEIGTSLTMIDGQAFQLRKRALGDEPGDVSSRAEKITQAVRHIEAVVRQVQVASEVEQSKLGFRPTEVNFTELVTNVLLQADAGRRIETDIAGLPAAVRGNASMLQQVIANLISNALKYSSPDSVVSIWGRSECQCAVLTITDRGIGIPAEEQARLFEPYYRAKNSRSVLGRVSGSTSCNAMLQVTATRSRP